MDAVSQGNYELNMKNQQSLHHYKEKHCFTAYQIQDMQAVYRRGHGH